MQVKLLIGQQRQEGHSLEQKNEEMHFSHIT